MFSSVKGMAYNIHKNSGRKPMTYLEKIAFFQNRRDEVPNQELARELAATKNIEGIHEIAENLGNKNKNIRSDCLKVLYEIGYLSPGLIADQVQTFLRLLDSKDNRMVWGAMIALASIASLKPKEIWTRVDDILAQTRNGTVITQVWGMRALAKVAAADPAYKAKVMPFLVEMIRTCIPRDVPTHAESILCAVDKGNAGELLSVMESRRSELTPAQLKRYKAILKQVEGT